MEKINVVVCTNDTEYKVTVKNKLDALDPNTPSGRTAIRHQVLEKLYWQKKGAEFRIIIAEDISDALAQNIADVMKYWQPQFANSAIGKLKHLIARGIVRVPMDEDRIRYGDILREIDVEKIYGKYQEAQVQRNISYLDAPSY